MGAKKYNGWYKVCKSTKFKHGEVYMIWTERYGVDIVYYNENTEGWFKMPSIINRYISYNPKNIKFWRKDIVSPNGLPLYVYSD